MKCGIYIQISEPTALGADVLTPSCDLPEGHDGDHWYGGQGDDGEKFDIWWKVND